MNRRDARALCRSAGSRERGLRDGDVAACRAAAFAPAGAPT
ncbi:hypothetical protein [Thauera sp.]|nr:hypothetical protein [Thauera sp.]